MEKGLIHFDEARAALAQITTVDEAKAVRDKAEAARVYAKQAKYSLVVQNDCAEIKIWAERRAGELLRDMAEKGERASGHGGDRASCRAQLEDLGIEKTQSHRWQRMASIPEPELKAHIAETKKQGEELTTASVLRMTHKAPVDIFTGEIEWYTPTKYIESCRVVLGSIDCDPASSEFAQKTVKAKQYFTQNDNGLDQAWKGRIFLNPPYSAQLIKKFTEHLLSELKSGNIITAILLTNNNTDTSWWHDVADAAGAVCFTRGRISFYNQKGEFSAPTNGQTFFYFGDDIGNFKKEFSQYGLVVML